MDLFRIYETFKCEDDCHNYLIKLKWPQGVRCVYCNDSRVYKRRSGHRFKCRSCNKSFSVTVGTIFHATKLPLRKWFLATAQILAAKKGISSLQLSRVLQINKDTAWYMQYRIREAMKSDELLRILSENTKEKEFVLEKKKDWENFAYSTVKVNQNKGKTANNYANGRNNKAQKSLRQTISPGYFPILQRAVIGQFHRLSQTHIDGYIQEILFKRVNHNLEAFDYLMEQACAFCWEMHERSFVNRPISAP